MTRVCPSFSQQIVQLGCCNLLNSLLLAAALLLQGQMAGIYPPDNLSNFAQALFLHGATDQATWHCKLALFLYVLLDRQGGTAGQRIDLASFRYL